MQKAKLTFEDIEQAEKAAAARRSKRNSVFKGIMKDRDRGWFRLSNGVVMLWPVPGEWSESLVLEDGSELRTWTGNHVPEGHFVLKVGDEERMFDAEEFRKCLRWV